MLTSKDRLIEGVSAYILNDLAPAVPNKALKVFLGGIADLIKRNPAVVDNILAHPMARTFIPQTDEGIDITPALESMREGIRLAGCLPAIIPAIPILMPHEQELDFKPEDVERLLSRIGG